MDMSAEAAPSSRHANANNQPPAVLPSPSICPLCCEETSGPIVLGCQHFSCKSCLARWVEREEASGQTTPPSCPFCRSTIGDDDVRAILGRPFRPRECGAAAPLGEGEIDEFTLNWLSEHTVPCGGCGARIEKESGCDLIECLCGFRFCFSCGVVGGGCGCNPGHEFLSGDVDDILPEPIRDRNGRVDLKSCILRSEVRPERERLREERIDEEEERWWYSEEAVAVCSCNGRWLYSPSKKGGCIAMLTQQLSHMRIRDGRWRQRYKEEIEQEKRWECDPQVRAVELAESGPGRYAVWGEYYQDTVNTCTCNGRWLFSRNTKLGCVRMLGQQAGYERIRDERESRRYWTTKEAENRWDELHADIRTSSGSWLFASIDNRACVLRLSKRLCPDGMQVRGERAYHRGYELRRHDGWCENNPGVCPSTGRWLFSRSPILMLTQQLNCVDIRDDREDARYLLSEDADEALDDSAVNAALCTSNGTWLFSSCNNNACIYLLTKQLCPARRETRERRAERREDYEDELNEENCKEDDPEFYAPICTRNGNWLFCAVTNAGSVLVLAKQTCPIQSVPASANCFSPPRRYAVEHCRTLDASGSRRIFFGRE